MNLLESLVFLINEMSPYILLGFLIAGLMHAFVPQSVMSGNLSGSGLRSVLKAAAIGIPLPLCSCGVLPTAVSMHRNGASKGATTSFLIATPQTGIDSISATYAMLGPAFAIIRPIAALVTALGGGWFVGRNELPKSGSDDVVAVTCQKSFWQKCIDALRYGFIDLLGSIGGWLIAGLIIAALITIYVPADMFAQLGSVPILSMLAVLVIAIPMYVCATGSIPIAMSLVLKGLSPGTAFVLLMAGPAVNFASFTLITKELGRKSAWIYLISIVVGAIGFGLVIDYLLPKSWFAIGGVSQADACCHHQVFPSICSAILGVLLLFTYLSQLLKPTKKFENMTKEYVIVGMNCVHCQASVIKAIKSVAGVIDVDVNLSTGKAVVEGQHDEVMLIQAIKNAGFDLK